MAQGNSQADPEAIMNTERVSELLWNRPESSPWGRYKVNMSIKLNMNTLACRADSKKRLNGQNPTISGLYRIAGVDWLLAEEEEYFLPPP